MKKRSVFYLAAGILLLLAALWVFLRFNVTVQQNPVHIAVAAPLSGKDSAVGASFLRGIRLYFDEVNRSGGINGKNLVLDIFDDQNTPKVAEKMAEIIASDSQAVGVIGHHYSGCSIRAGKVYKKYRLPAVTPSSTNVNLTKDNEWYFRTVFTDRLQGRFLANYARKILKTESVSIIHDDREYGGYLAQIFKEESEALGMTVKHVWGYASEEPDVHMKFRRIVSDLQVAHDAGVVFLSTHSSDGVQLVKLIRDAFIKNTVMVPDAYGAKSFIDGFKDYPKERRNPGYYTNGILITSPMIFDIANENAQRFKDVYIEKYGEEPDWISAYAFDCAMMLAEAVKNSGVVGESGTLKADRQKVRDYLAGLSSVEKAVEGVTGYNFFDKNGDAVKPIFFGIFKQRNIISALTQLHPVYDIHQVPDFKKAVKERRILIYNGRYMYKTDVVYTGVNLNKIEDLDLEKMTCTLDFHIWFRDQSGGEAEDIEFLNAAEPVRLGEPVDKGKVGGMDTTLYHVKGRFKLDFIPTRYAFGYHFIGFQFRHKFLSQNNLVFVADILGMRAGEMNHAVDDMNKIGLLGNEKEWQIQKLRIFQDLSDKNTLENLENLDIQGKHIKYARFNYGVLIRKSSFTLRGKDFENINEDYLLVTGLTLLLVSMFLRKRWFFPRFAKTIWTVQVLLALMVLLCSEGIIVGDMIKNVSVHSTNLIKRLYDILWWVVPAMLLDMGAEPFIWNPMVKKTGRPVPDVLRRFTTYVIYFIALYGIIVFVFKTNITSLMATSGVIAMIVGFIIKANISNFFAGMVINQGNAVRTGDWIKVGSNDVGQVMDITWRSTKLKSQYGSLISIPNSTVSESLIHNYSFPTKPTQVGFPVKIKSSVSPDRVKKLLYDAVVSVEGEVSRPSVRFKGIEGDNGVYSVRFIIEDFGKKAACIEAVWHRIWALLKMTDLDMIPDEDGEINRGMAETSIKALNTIDVFRPFSDEEKSLLAARMEERFYKSDEVIVRQGDDGDSLFFVIEGVVGVWTQFEDESAPVELVRMGAGNFFGEMALMTGEARTSTIISITDARLFEITKAHIYPLLEANPEIMERLSQVLAERRRGQETKRSQSQKLVQHRDGKPLPKKILKRIKNFFRIY